MGTQELQATDPHHPLRAVELNEGKGAVIFLGRSPIFFAEFAGYWTCDHSVNYFERMPLVGTDTHDDIAFLKTHTLDDFLAKLRVILHDFDPDILENFY